MCEDLSSEYKPSPFSFPAMFMVHVFKSLHSTEKMSVIYLVLQHCVLLQIHPTENISVSKSVCSKTDCLVTYLFVSEGRDLSKWEQCSWVMGKCNLTRKGQKKGTL